MKTIAVCVCNLCHTCPPYLLHVVAGHWHAAAAVLRPQQLEVMAGDAGSARVLPAPRCIHGSKPSVMTSDRLNFVSRDTCRTYVRVRFQDDQVAGPDDVSISH
jgi:hypothetical protein